MAENAVRDRDLPMLEAEYANIQVAGEFKPLQLAGDAGGVRARRILGQMIAEEQRAGA